MQVARDGSRLGTSSARDRSRAITSEKV